MGMWKLATVCAAALAVSGIASAETWTDPNGRLTFEQPAGWSTQVRRAPDGVTAIVTGTADQECQIISQPNPQTAERSAEAVRVAVANDEQFGVAQWVNVANGWRGIFPDNSASVTSRSSETNGAWPIQRAELRSPERPVLGALQMRPGFDIIAMCMSYGGPDATATYDRVIRSIGHPNDATWAAEAAAAAAAAAAPPPPAE